jgi:hypothetical protein
MEKKEMSFVMAMRDYFGVKQGQTLASFVRELKELDENDRRDFKKELEKVGYKIK